MPHKPPNIDEDGGSPPTALLPFFIALYSDRQLRFETLSKNPVDCVAAMLLDEEKSPQHSLVLFNCEAFDWIPNLFSFNSISRCLCCGDCHFKSEGKEQRVSYFTLETLSHSGAPTCPPPCD